MIYGELDRSSDGFFIKAKKSNSQWSIRHQVNTRDQVVEEAIFSSSNDGSYDCIDIRMDSEARDWSSYYLAMNLVPHSLLMSSTASKVHSSLPPIALARNLTSVRTYCRFSLQDVPLCL